MFNADLSYISFDGCQGAIVPRVLHFSAVHYYYYCSGYSLDLILLRLFSRFDSVLLRLFSGFDLVLLRLFSRFDLVLLRLFSRFDLVLLRLFSRFDLVLLRLFSRFDLVLLRLFSRFDLVLLRLFSSARHSSCISFSLLHITVMLKCPPLRERVYRSHTSIRDLSSHGRSGRYKEWTSVHMDRALKAVISEGVSVRQASEVFGVPRSTLGDRASGRVIPGANSGPEKYLTTAEEIELVQFLTRVAAIGYGKSRKEVMAIAQGVVGEKCLNKVVSNGWWESFCRRNPTISLRAAAPLSMARAKATDPEMLSRYFDLLERTLDQNDLRGRPNQIFNMDESGVPLDPKSPRIVAERGSGAVTIGSGNKSQVTGVSAAGFSMPPMVIWDRKTLAPELTHGEVEGTMYGLSGSGWMDRELFGLWFKHHFLSYVPSVRPILLLMDGHSSHYCPSTIRLAAQEHIILFALPPNTTHLSQPLDKGCFGPLKMAWREECHRYLTMHPGRIITKFQFSSLFRNAWLKSMSVANITGGFRVTGVYPVDRNALSPPVEECETLSRETGLSFIPLYSPSCQRPRSPVQGDTSTLDHNSSFVDSPAANRDDSFTEEEITLFQTRYENGYDIYLR